MARRAPTWRSDGSCRTQRLPAAVAPAGDAIGCRALLQLIGKLEQRTEERGVKVGLVVGDELVDAALHHEAAELDELTGSGAAEMHPAAAVAAGSGELSPVQPC